MTSGKPGNDRSLRELIDGADERGLAAAGLACLDRCLPLLAADRDDALRPAWAAVARADGAAWAEAVAEARVELDAGDGGDGGDAAEAVRGMLASAPEAWSPESLRAWVGACSGTALALHGRYDAAGADEGLVERCRAGDEDGAGPLLAGELRRQRAVLESVAHGPTGLRRARELSVEGGRVLRAVVSRRARTTA
ncbi:MULTISPECIES: hypothetical protein [unclassified Streptomyces]|uniref:hypothetical protein n=1 Tax=unclassified Streptomyces TaxID=2593676 RepID=UPI0006B0591D|nr:MULTISPECIES: hypothetical protein [unclassified Streptomyces]KOX26581.1 hypothetical protein ADL06_15320 [Streptomyces sp. NRRL F-6491]KOX49999.1 hypothetical protein ADL08_07345 [Streptomyces sp. NRRL F-6492]